MQEQQDRWNELADYVMPILGPRPAVRPAHGSKGPISIALKSDRRERATNSILILAALWRVPFYDLTR